MTEKTKAPLLVAKGVNNTQSIETIKKIEVKPSFEQLQKENEELKKKLSSLPEDLEQKIEYFNRKRILIKKFDHLTEKRNNLLNHLDQVAEITTKSDFSNDRYVIIVQNANASYNEKEVLKIQNPVIICEVINFMITKIEKLQSDLQKQIEE